MASHVWEKQGSGCSTDVPHMISCDMLVKGLPHMPVDKETGGGGGWWNRERLGGRVCSLPASSLRA